MLKEGQVVKDFSLKDSEGKLHKLSDYMGKKVVIYFYPKDDTPGCTKEACAFRDDFKKYEGKKAVIIGISAENENSHKKFKEKYGLPFVLLCDPEKHVINEFGALKNSFLGKKYSGIRRSTFIVDENGKLIKVFPDVSVEGHSEEILSCL